MLLERFVTSKVCKIKIECYGRALKKEESVKMNKSAYSCSHKGAREIRNLHDRFPWWVLICFLIIRVVNSVGKMSEITKRKKGQILNNSERQLILNLMNYIKSKNSDKSVSEIIREISKATGCSERTIYKIKKEASKGITVVTNKTRMRKKENKNSRNVKYDSFVKSSIRKKIHNYFLQNNSPTLNTILHLVNSDPDLPNFKRSTLHTLLKEIGFVYEQKGKKSLLTESKDLVEQRQAYLRDVRKFRSENRWIVYLGETVISLVKKEMKKNETSKSMSNIIEPMKLENIQVSCEAVNTVFINASELMKGTTLVYSIDNTALENGVTTDSLPLNDEISFIQNNSPSTGSILVHKDKSDDITAPTSQPLEEGETDYVKQNKKSSRELRLMIMHAGSDEGFIQGADFISLSKKKTEDVEKYKNWFLEKLLPKIPPNSVVVTDNNASYHKIEENFPDVSWKKQQIKNWFLSKYIKVEHLNQKKELLSLVNQVRPMYSTNFKIDELARERGIIILNLPPFHYELNPLNLAWAQIKCYVRANVKSFKIKKIKQLIREGFYSISQVNWMNYMHHIRQVEDLLWSVDLDQEKCQDINLPQLYVREKEDNICERFNNL